MPLTREQAAKIAIALSQKVVMPCPACGQKAREVQQDIILLEARYALGAATSASDLMKGGPRPNIGANLPNVYPCVVVVCLNCGHTELFNVHIAGLAKEAGVPAPGERVDVA